MQELGFIYFVCDPRSDYQYLVDIDMRMQAVKQGEGCLKNGLQTKQY